MAFEITLGLRSLDHRVVVDGKDITSAVRGIEIVAYGGQPPEVKIVLTSKGVIKGENGLVYEVNGKPLAETQFTEIRDE